MLLNGLKKHFFQQTYRLIGKPAAKLIDLTLLLTIEFGRFAWYLLYVLLRSSLVQIVT